MISSLALAFLLSSKQESSQKPIIMLMRGDDPPISQNAKEELRSLNQDELLKWCERRQLLLKSFSQFSAIIDPSSIGLSQLQLRLEILRLLTTIPENHTLNTLNSGQLGNSIKSMLSATYTKNSGTIQQSTFSYTVTPASIVYYKDAERPSQSAISHHGWKSDFPNQQTLSSGNELLFPPRHPQGLLSTSLKITEESVGRFGVLQRTQARKELADYLQETLKEVSLALDEEKSKIKNLWPQAVLDINQKARNLGDSKTQDYSDSEKRYLLQLFTQSGISNPEQVRVTGATEGVAIKVNLKTQSGDVIKTELIIPF